MGTNVFMKILFVCMGNICRSPAAENVMRHLLRREGLEKSCIVDSAGTIGFHTGNPPDARMRQAGTARGIEISGKARQIKAADLTAFDLILVADRDNLRDVEALAAQVENPNPVRLFCEFCTEHTEKEVPDPYYGGASGFELVLDLLEDGCEELIRQYKDGRLASTS